jgi:hypothetical protein
VTDANRWLPRHSVEKSGYLSDSEKIHLREVCAEIGVDWLKTSTGFAHSGATIDGLKLVRRHSPTQVQIKAAGCATWLLVSQPGRAEIGSEPGQGICVRLRTMTLATG